MFYMLVRPFSSILIPASCSPKIPSVFEAFPLIFMDTHGLTLTQNGLVFLGVGIGSTLGAILNFYFSLQYSKQITHWKGFPPAEYRLYGAMVGSPALVIGCFWLGWTGQYASVSWVAPAVSTVILGFAISLIFMSFLVCVFPPS